MMDRTGRMENWRFGYCPSWPAHALAWDAMASEFEWLRNLKGVPQDPGFHAEGDVLVHTKMVMEALIGLTGWQPLTEPERSIVFTGALMHDIGKPACTRNENGRIRSPYHARKGAAMARMILWKELEDSVPFYCREQIVSLIRYHGLPLWFLDKENPEREIVRVSQFVKMENLALLAEADVRGRVCEDQPALLETISLFREFCKEKDCYDTPYTFRSGLSRYHYLSSNRPSLYYEPFDHTEFEVILMSGLPGSGKDTWIKNEGRGRPIISLDALREELGISVDENQGKVVSTAKERAKELMRKKKSFIWNGTNVTKALRKQVVQLCLSYRAKVRIIYVETDYKTLLERNEKREKPVPAEVLNKLIRKLEVPDVTEAHELTYVITTGV